MDIIKWEIRWKDAANCIAPWKCYFTTTATPLLLRSLLKRQWMREKQKFVTYIISFVLSWHFILL